MYQKEVEQTFKDSGLGSSTRKDSPETREPKRVEH